MANTSKRGFASMDPSKQREIASKGGRAAHAKGTAHEFTSDEARVAGRKGGEAVSRDRQHMSAIGREGGHSRGARARAAASGDAQNGGNSQPLGSTTSSSIERQATTERSGFERSGGNLDRSIAANERGGERGSYAAQDRGSNNASRNERGERNGERNERGGDNVSGSHGPFSGRDNI
jgi:general stress protein YciG